MRDMLSCHMQRKMSKSQNFEKNEDKFQQKKICKTSKVTAYFKPVFLGS